MIQSKETTKGESSNHLKMQTLTTKINSKNENFQKVKVKMQSLTTQIWVQTLSEIWILFEYCEAE